MNYSLPISFYFVSLLIGGGNGDPKWTKSGWTSPYNAGQTLWCRNGSGWHGLHLANVLVLSDAEGLKKGNWRVISFVIIFFSL